MSDSENREISNLMLREDWKHLKESLPKFPVGIRRSIKMAYKSEFLAGMDAEPVGHMKANKGRFRANIFLLHELEKLKNDNQTDNT